MNQQDFPNYQITRVIGSGSFGYVFEAIDQKTNQKVALKRVEKVGSQLSREFEILLEVKDCDHVVKILEIFYTRRQGTQKLIQNIVFEYLEDNLENKIQTYKKQKKNFSDLDIKIKRVISTKYQKVQNIFTPRILLIEIQNRKIIIFILKLRENILLGKNNVVKICDFGSSKIIDSKGKNTPYIVSRYYRAPELILCITKYTNAIDIWAVGCILAELIIKDPLFQGKSEGDQMFAIMKIMGTPTKQELEEFGKLVPFDQKIFNEFRQFKPANLESLLFSFNDLRNLLDLLKKMLAYLPSNRINASDALKHPFFEDVRDE